MSLRDLLLDTMAHLRPPAVIEGLTEEQALEAAPGASHSIAAILAHMEFWQAWFLQRMDGVAIPPASSAAAGWPPVAPGGWNALVQRFQSGLERAAEISEDASRVHLPITPAIEFAPLSQLTVEQALIHIAQHNSHHLGQIITLRQIRGLWPPPAGSWTW